MQSHPNRPVLVKRHSAGPTTPLGSVRAESSSDEDQLNNNDPEVKPGFINSKERPNSLSNVVNTSALLFNDIGKAKHGIQSSTQSTMLVTAISSSSSQGTQGSKQFLDTSLTAIDLTATSTNSYHSKPAFLLNPNGSRLINTSTYSTDSTGSSNNKSSPGSPVVSKSRRVSFSHEIPALTPTEIIVAQQSLGIVPNREVYSEALDEVENAKVIKSHVRRKSGSMLERIIFKKRDSFSKDSSVINEGVEYSKPEDVIPNESNTSISETTNSSVNVEKDHVPLEMIDSEAVWYQNRNVVRTGFLKQKVHPMLTEADMENPDMEGVLLILSENTLKETWKPRYCFQKGQWFFVLKNQVSKLALHIINLRHCILDTYFQRRGAFCLHRIGEFQTLVLEADNSELKLKWMESLLKGIYTSRKAKEATPDELAESFDKWKTFSMWKGLSGVPISVTPQVEKETPSSYPRRSSLSGSRVRAKLATEVNRAASSGSGSTTSSDAKNESMSTVTIDQTTKSLPTPSQSAANIGSLNVTAAASNHSNSPKLNARTLTERTGMMRFENPRHHHTNNHEHLTVTPPADAPVNPLQRRRHSIATPRDMDTLYQFAIVNASRMNQGRRLSIGDQSKTSPILEVSKADLRRTGSDSRASIRRHIKLDSYNSDSSENSKGETSNQASFVGTKQLEEQHTEEISPVSLSANNSSPKPVDVADSTVELFTPMGFIRVVQSETGDDTPSAEALAIAKNF